MQFDPAIPALRPLIDLSTNDSFACLTCRAPMHWLSHGEYDNLGASMSLYGPTRRLLKLAGLPIELGNPCCVESPNVHWRSVVEKFVANSLSHRERLYAARLFMYSGFFDAAQSVLVQEETSEESELEVATRWLRHLVEGVRNPLLADPSRVATT